MWEVWSLDVFCRVFDVVSFARGAPLLVRGIPGEGE